LDGGHFGYIKTSLFISLCILRDLPRRRSPGSYAVGEIALYFYVPMEQFFDGTDQEIQKHKEERDKSGKFKKTRKK
jgi:hypothetical protein